jgi:hypothetical protein
LTKELFEHPFLPSQNTFSFDFSFAGRMGRRSEKEKNSARLNIITTKKREGGEKESSEEGKRK